MIERNSYQPISPSTLPQSPRCAVRSRDPFCRFVVADNLLGSGVPLNAAAKSYRDVAEMTNRRGAMANLDIADRQLAGLQTVQEVLMVIRADIEPLVTVGHRLFDDLFGRALDLAAIDEDRPFTADERHSAGAILLTLADDQDDSIGIGVSDSARLRDFVVLLWMKCGGSLSGDGAGVVHAESPLRDVDVMRPKFVICPPE